VTTDDRISDDLAIVARTSRAQPIAIETTLRAAGALAASERPVSPEGTPTSAIAMLQLSRIYVARVARAVAGTTSVACAGLLLAMLIVPHHLHDDVLSDLAYMSKVWVTVSAIAIVFAAHAVASRVATRRFLRAVANGSRPRALVHGVAGWSTAGPIAGVTALGLFVGMMVAVLGGYSLEFLIADQHAVVGLTKAVRWLTLVTLAPAMVASIVGAAVVAQMSLKRPWRLVAVGAAIVVVTIAVGLSYDVGPVSQVEATLHLRVIPDGGYPSAALRSILTATGTIGMFLLVTGVVLRIRRREDAIVDEYAPSSVCGLR